MPCNTYMAYSLYDGSYCIWIDVDYRPHSYIGIYNQRRNREMEVVATFIGFGFILLLVSGWYTGFGDGQDERWTST